MSTPHRLDIQRITKRYPGVVANDAVSLTVAPGSIHAVLGENGAGKSTLMKIIYGSVKPDDGELRWNGQPLQVKSPQHARAMGISMVFQHFSLFDTLTVAENVWLGVDKAMGLPEVTRLIQEKARTYGLDIDPQAHVHALSVGEMQRVELIRALLTQPQLLILDEPTSVLTPGAVDKLFVVLRQLAAQGCSILYISHKLHEIRALCDTCTVMRGGKVTGVCDPRQETNESLSQLMIGAAPPALTLKPSAVGQTLLKVRGLSLPAPHTFGVALQRLTLDVKSGEIVGIAGVSGNGQAELLQVLSGENPHAPAGTVFISGTDVSKLGPRQRRALGLHFVPEERLGRGAVPTLSLADNLLLTRKEGVGRWGWLRTATLRQQAMQLIDRFGVKTSGPDAPAKSLSGGNLQKFIVGREIAARPKLLIVSQPTWGVDVGAAAQIRKQLLALRDAGCALLVVSEELDELFEICDRLHVVAKGRLSPSTPRAQASVAQIGEWMSGLWPETSEVTHV